MNRSIYVFYFVQVEGPGFARGKNGRKKILNKTKINWEKKFEFLLAYDTPDRP